MRTLEEVDAVVAEAMFIVPFALITMSGKERISSRSSTCWPVAMVEILEETVHCGGYGRARFQIEASVFLVATRLA